MNKGTQPLYHTLFSEEFFLRESNSPWFQEAILQIVWNEQLLNRPFQSVCGRPIEVQFPGIWNVSAGPDFHDAVIEIDGVAKRGAVELHLRPDNWREHGHQHDEEYAGVLLHVVWDNPRNYRQYPEGVPLLCLENLLSVDLEELIRTVDVASYPYAAKVHGGSYANWIADMDDEKVIDMLTSYGLARIARKVTGFAEGIMRDGIDTAAYEAVAGALGYRSNQQAFVDLTRLVPLSQLADLSTEDREAVLFGVSGLLPDPTRAEVDEAWLAWVRDRWRRWWPRRTGHRVISWSRRRQRPQNRAERRLLALIELLERSQCSLGAAMLGAHVGDSKKQTIQNLEALFTVPGDERSRNFSDFSSRLGRPAGLLGSSRVRDLIVNVALPLSLADAMIRRDDPARKHLRQTILAMPKLAANRRFEEAAHCFFMPPARAKKVVTTAVSQLGLLELYDAAALAD